MTRIPTVARLLMLGLLPLALFLAGCSSSAPTSTSAKSASGSGKEGNTGRTARSGATAGGEGWKAHPDVPYVPLTQEVDGIELPRVSQEPPSKALAGSVPVDVGNPQAKGVSSRPERGDWVVVRLNSEPKSLNPIVETSAVQSIMGEYVQEPLARLNRETLEYEPYLAEKWVTEDSVKLSPDFPGKERRVRQADGKPAPELTIEYKRAPEGEDDPVLTLTTTDAAGQPVGGVWVGLYPVEKIVGAPPNGYHFWSESNGSLEVSGIESGRYDVRAGAEVFGETKESDDGTLVVTPVTPGNSLAEELRSSSQQSLTLKPDDYQDVQRQTIYTYFLRENVTWSDGTPFTTKDLEFAYSVINNPFVDGESIRVYYHDLVDLEPLDEHTVRMKYRQQYFKALEFTGELGLYTPPWHVFQAFFKDQGKELTLDRLSEQEEKNRDQVSVHGAEFGRFYNTDSRYNQQPLGTGPYVFTKWERGDRVELRRNDNYWNDKRTPHLDRIVFRFIPDNVTALRALQAGEIDFLYRMDAGQFFEDLAGPPSWFKDKYVKASWYVPTFSYVGWNMLKPKFQDRRVRTALAMLFNRKEFVDKKLHGEAVLVSGSAYYFSPFYDHQVKPLGHAPDVARDLLADAGWADTDNDGLLDKDGKPFEFGFLMPPGNPVAEELAAIFQKNLKQAGIRMNIATTEWASFIEKIRAKDFEAVTLAWIAPIESDPYQIWHSSGAGPDKRGSNHVSFANKQADELIETLRLTLDEDKRKHIHWSFHRVLDREQPYMFLHTPKDFGAYHNRFRGVKWYAVRPGFDLTEWWVPKDLQQH